MAGFMMIIIVTIMNTLPLPPQTYHVLLALGDRTLHGYGLIEAFEELTEGRETLLPGSLYATLARMVEEGLLVEVDPPADATSGGPRRRYYRMTDFGRSAALAESERRELLLRSARARRLAPEPPP
ncbi:MAG TPA: PadR family transcriptional regulator [Longimicrobiales bacterium]|nr:PadR family transcriptional regulator [Longimicrobiales bacterium]